MSIFEPCDIACPGCGVVTRREVAITIAAARRRDLREAILAETFQRFSCPSCGRPYVLDGPFMLIDFERKQWIGCFPRGSEADWARHELEPQTSFQTSMIDHTPASMRKRAPGFVVRAVFGLSALREKLLCFDAGVDDVTLELLKLDLLRSEPDLVMDPIGRPLLDRIDETTLEFRVSTRSETGWRDGILATPRARLAAIDPGQPKWAPVAAKLTAGAYVDVGRLMNWPDPARKPAPPAPAATSTPTSTPDDGGPSAAGSST